MESRVGRRDESANGKSVGKRQELQRAKGEILPPPPPLFASNGVINDTRVCRMK